MVRRRSRWRSGAGEGFGFRCVDGSKQIWYPRFGCLAKDGWCIEDCGKFLQPSRASSAPPVNRSHLVTYEFHPCQGTGSPHFSTSALNITYLIRPRRIVLTSPTLRSDPGPFSAPTAATRDQRRTALAAARRAHDGRVVRSVP